MGATLAVRERAARQRAGKYLAISFELEARIALLRGDFGAATRAVEAARAALAATPSALVAWKLESLAVRVAECAGDSQGARDARLRAAQGIERIVEGLDGDDREAFLASAAVREVIALVTAS